MTPPPTISVVIDNYNYARFLGDAIESALRQGYPPCEVVVVDDGSTDASRDVIAGFGPAVVPVLKRNGGQASAVNAGFAASHGDLVLFLDADDMLFPDALARVAASARPDMGKLHFRLQAVDAAGRPLGYTLPPSDRPLATGDVVPALVDAGRYVTPTMSGNVFPREVLRRILPVPEDEFRISADGYLVTAAPFHGPVVAVEERLAAYRVHGGNWWAPADLDAHRLREFALHDVAKYRCVRTQAATVGVAVAEDLETRDHFHLRARMGSWRLDPARHPFPEDSGARLLRSGARATLRSDLPMPRRLAFTAWFAAVAAAPAPVARSLLRWLYVPQRRPRWLGVARRAVRRGARRRG